MNGNNALQNNERIFSEDVRVPYGPGTKIHVRNKRRKDLPPRGAVILMHGSTYPGSAFDLRLDGFSWMDHLAVHGWDAYAPDLPGYGQSSRPAQMDQPPQANPPLMRTAEAVSALAAVVEFVARRCSVDRVHLIGWSWGTAITATYTAANPTRVERLVLYAPLWIRSGFSPINVEGPLGAYRVVTRQQAEERRRAGLSPEKALRIMPKAWYDAWADASFASDPWGQGQRLRAPNGTVQDMREYWASGRATFDPAAITAPVLLVVGDHDYDTPPALAQGLFGQLVNARSRRIVIVGDATHSLLIETQRMQLFQSVQGFLEEA